MGMNGLIADSDLRIAVLVPCYNEELAIPSVVRDFRNALQTRRSMLLQ